VYLHADGTTAEKARLFCNCGAKYALQSKFIAAELADRAAGDDFHQEIFAHAHNLKSVRDAARAVIFYKRTAQHHS
jgi:hypothetical protein